MCETNHRTETKIYSVDYISPLCKFDQLLKKSNIYRISQLLNNKLPKTLVEKRKLVSNFQCCFTKLKGTLVLKEHFLQNILVLFGKFDFFYTGKCYRILSTFVHLDNLRELFQVVVIATYTTLGSIASQHI